MARRSFSLAWYILPLYLGLLFYASFYPFLDWNPSAIELGWVFGQPWPHIRWRHEDNWLNVLGYVPLGFLLALALLRSWGASRELHRSAPRELHWRQALLCVLGAVLLGSVWSWLIETLQISFPRRDSSLRDWLTNTLGSGIGALLAAALERSGQLGHWQAWRSRWITTGREPEVALLVAWPLALLTPTAVPFGLGQVSERLLLLGA
jgi:glycopeptide antibiotics resistance protein